MQLDSAYRCRCQASGQELLVKQYPALASTLRKEMATTAEFCWNAEYMALAGATDFRVPRIPELVAMGYTDPVHRDDTVGYFCLVTE